MIETRIGGFATRIGLLVEVFEREEEGVKRVDFHAGGNLLATFVKVEANNMARAILLEERSALADLVERLKITVARERATVRLLRWAKAKGKAKRCWCGKRCGHKSKHRTSDAVRRKARRR